MPADFNVAFKLAAVPLAVVADVMLALTADRTVLAVEIVLAAVAVPAVKGAAAVSAEVTPGNAPSTPVTTACKVV